MILDDDTFRTMTESRRRCMVLLIIRRDLWMRADLGEDGSVREYGVGVKEAEGGKVNGGRGWRVKGNRGWL
jgi:hypothetical protein